jgi:large subunit ribosomal protein L13
MNCYQAKAGELAKHWYVIDAQDAVVGRLAAQIAPILMGKHRPTYTPHIDTGDYVIVTNVNKVVFTGEKWRQKSYQRYTGYPGGQKEEAAWKLFQRRPERILELAVQRMMPKNKLGRQMLAKLKLYVGPNHPHQAQQPIPLEPLSGRPSPAGAVFVTATAPKADGSGTRPAKANGAASTPHTGPVAALESPPVVEALPPPAPEAAPPEAVAPPPVAHAPAAEEAAPSPPAPGEAAAPSPHAAITEPEAPAASHEHEPPSAS